MFVPAPQGMQNLVHDETCRGTQGADGDVLLTTKTTDVGVTPATKTRGKECVSFLLRSHPSHAYAP